MKKVRKIASFIFVSSCGWALATVQLCAQDDAALPDEPGLALLAASPAQQPPPNLRQPKLPSQPST